MKGTDGKEKTNTFDPYGGDDYGDYGNDYGSDDDYGCADIGNAKQEFKGVDFGLNPDLMLQDC